MTAITPEMIEAGRQALLDAWKDGDDDPSTDQEVARIYTAMRALEPARPLDAEVDHLFATAIFDSAYTARLQEHPEELEHYLGRARSLRHHMQVLGIDVCDARLSTERDELRSALEAAVERYEEDCGRPEHWAYDARALLARIKGAE